MRRASPDALSGQLRERLPGFAAWLEAHKHETLAQAARRPSPAMPLSAELMGILCASTEQLLGPQTALRLKARLERDTFVLAAHHHGINTHPEFAQSALFFALPELALQAEDSAVPVLACSTISLRSYSFPRGLLLGRPGNDADKEPWLRLPVFPAVFSDVSAGAAPAITPAFCRKAAAHWKKMALRPWELDVALNILDDHVLTEEVLSLPDFSGQATRINAALWKRGLGPSAPPLVFLDLEAIAVDLLLTELEDKDSLFSLILCDAGVRKRVFTALTGIPGCWTPENIKTECALEGRTVERKGGGTFFFWYMDAKGRRHSLFPEDSGLSTLCGAGRSFPLEREALADALRERTLRPGLFCSYVSLLSHGMSFGCGNYMIDYLPAMCKGLASALRLAGKGEAFAQGLSGIDQRIGLGSVFMPFCRGREDGFSPAGMLELLGHNRPLGDSLARFAALGVHEAIPASLAAWYLECIPAANRLPDWESARLELAASGALLPLSLA